MVCSNRQFTISAELRNNNTLMFVLDERLDTYIKAVEIIVDWVIKGIITQNEGQEITNVVASTYRRYGVVFDRVEVVKKYLQKIGFLDGGKQCESQY